MTLARVRSVLSVTVISLVFGMFFSRSLSAQEPPPVPPNPLAFCDAQVDTESPAQCLARDLTNYMNDVIEGTQGLANIRLLSPAFNLTSHLEPPVYSSMVQCGANFAGLWGFSGNTYTLNGTDAMTYYANNGWAAAFAGKPVVFTEF